MLKNLMEDKRLDLDAPLLSVRRFASDPAPDPRPSAASSARGSSPNPKSRRSTLPFYKSDLKSGPIRNPGVVPFVWEQSPGHPKAAASAARPDRPSSAPRLPPGRVPAEKEPDSAPPVAEIEKRSAEISQDAEKDTAEVCNEEEEKFLDALETLSRTESFFLNCSVSGLTEAPENREVSGRFSTDPQVRDFMMGRFLPAAKAVATDAALSGSRKAPAQAREPAMRAVERVENGDRPRVRFPHCADLVEEGESTSCSYGYEDEEEEYYDHGNLSLRLRGCGLLPKFYASGSFCLLNPMPGVKAPGRRLSAASVRRVRGPQVKAMQQGSIGQPEDEYSWEAVYKHKLMHGSPHPQGQDVSKRTSESNPLTIQSDSPTADGSSPQQFSNTGGISPYRNEQSPFHEGKGFLGVPTRDRMSSKSGGSDSFGKDCDNCWVVTPRGSSQCESGSLSPAVERTLHVDTIHMSETPNTMLTSLGISLNKNKLTRSVDNDSEVGIQSQRIDKPLAPDTHNGDALQSKNSDIEENGLEICSGISGGADNENNGFKLSDKNDHPVSRQKFPVKDDADLISSLLPPPLPNSPSESWLSRTLPSVSLKSQPVQSFLGIHCQTKKQAANSSLIIHKKEIPTKPVKLQHGQTRFADMLAKPLSPRP